VKQLQILGNWVFWVSAWSGFGVTISAAPSISRPLRKVSTRRFGSSALPCSHRDV